MAEIEFREVQYGVLVETLGGVYQGQIRDFGDDCGYVYISSGTRDADELEQIAAKLRELNGEPNTHALDERVKELVKRLPDMEAVDVGNPDDLVAFISEDDILRTIKELFPAELKEKLKERQDG